MGGGPDLSGGDDLCEGVVEDGLVGDQVQEVDAVHVEGQDVLAALQWIIVPPHRKEAWSEQLPLGQSLEHLSLGLAGGDVLHLGPAALDLISVDDIIKWSMRV